MGSLMFFGLHTPVVWNAWRTPPMTRVHQRHARQRDLDHVDRTLRSSHAGVRLAPYRKPTDPAPAQVDILESTAP
jgi:hypothetical protein